MVVSIVCVNYNSYSSLEKYLDSIQNAWKNLSDIILKVYVADNSTNKEDIKNRWTFDLKIHKFDNLGYFGGAFAIINTNKEIKNSSYCIISNVDLQVDIDFFRILNDLKIDTSIGCIAPQIYSFVEKRDKNPQRLNRPSRRKIKELIFMFSHPFIQLAYKNTFYKRKKIKKQLPSCLEIYCGHGSFIILTNHFINCIDTFEYPCFLYCEELFLGELLRQNNLKTLYYPKLKILDDEHISTGNLPNQDYYHYNLESLKYIYHTFYSQNKL